MRYKRAPDKNVHSGKRDECGCCVIVGGQNSVRLRLSNTGSAITYIVGGQNSVRLRLSNTGSAITYSVVV